MGYDSDDPLADGEVGKCGVAIGSLADMELLFDQIPLDNVSTSMTINSPAAIRGRCTWLLPKTRRRLETAWWDAAKRHPKRIHCAEGIHLSAQALDETGRGYFGIRRGVHSKLNPISISGYHIREAGSTAIQELAFTLRDGIEYVEWWRPARLNVDDFAPRLSFFFNAHNDFFEEIAKYRAARRIWYEVMSEDLGRNPPGPGHYDSTRRPQATTLLTAQPEPYNNVVRTALQALAAVMGGTKPAHQFPGRGMGAAHGVRSHPGPSHAADSGIRKRSHEYRRSPGRVLFRRNAYQRS